MVRTYDTKNICDCGGTYLDSNRNKHLKTKKHLEWEARKKIGEGTKIETKEKPKNKKPIKRLTEEEIEELLKSDPELKQPPTSQWAINLLDPEVLQRLYKEPKPTPFVDTRYWKINEPEDPDLVEELVRRFRLDYQSTGRSLKKRWVNDFFYNIITSYDDVVVILKQTYNKADSAFKMNYSFGIIVEYLDGDGGLEYELRPAAEIEYFTRQIFKKGELQGKTADLQNVYNRKTFNENILAESTKENICEWLRNLLKQSSARLIGIYSMAVKTIKMDQPIGCTNVELPEYIVKSKFIISLRSIQNNLCFFACIALAEECRRDRFMARTREIFCQFYGLYDIDNSQWRIILEKYEGIQCIYKDNIDGSVIDDIFKYEMMDRRFAINIFRVFKDGSCNVIRKSPFNPEDPQNPVSNERTPIYLNLFNNHFSYISDPTKIFRYRCAICDKKVKRYDNLIEHMGSCSTNVKFKFNDQPQVYSKSRNLIVELCGYYNFEVGELFIYDWLICFDFEAINLRHTKYSTEELMKYDKPNDNLKFISTQIPLSYSVVSNVPGYDNVIFYCSRHPRKLVTKLFEFFNVVQVKAKELMLEKLKPLMLEINKFAEAGNRHAKKHLVQIWEYCSAIPIVGFNSGGYDINAMLEYGFIEKILNSSEYEPFIIKSGKRYKGIKTDKNIFLDEMLYCAAGTTLDKFLKCYSDSKDDHKLSFCYQWLDSYKKLNYLIKDVPIEAFDNDLKRIKCTQEKYESIQKYCKDKELETVLEFLEDYNNRDVVPFIKACLEYKKFYYNLEIGGNIIKLDMFKDVFTLPGLAARIMNQTSLPENLFTVSYPPPPLDNTSPIINEKKLYKYAYQDIRRQMRNMKISDEIKFVCHLPTVEEVCQLMNKHNNRCLYCHKPLKDNKWSLDRIDCRENHTFRNCVISCIDCNKARSNRPFKQFYRESVLKRIKDPTIYIVDENNKNVFNLMKDNIVGGPSIVFHRYHEKDVTCIQRVHYDIENNKWFYDKKGKLVKKIVGFDANALYLWCIGQAQLCGILKYYKYNSKLNTLNEHYSPYYKGSWDTLLDDIKNEKFFGMVEVNIKVPRNKYEYFSEMPPLFINERYNSALAGDIMSKVIEYLGQKHTTNRKLIATMKAKKILLKSSLLKWYLDHGLKVTKIYGAIPAQKAKIYEGFVNWVSDSRRQGDVKTEFAIKAENAKNIGNSAFGQSIMNKEKHKKIRYVDENGFNKQKNNYWFYDAEEYLREDGSSVFEICMKKKNIKQDMPEQIGFGILQDAKLRMLQFHYDCLDKYVDRSNYQLIQMDTDSSYMALAGDNFEELIKPEMRKEFELDKNNWFPRTDTPENKAFDKRTPGLFKIEKEGIGMIALCSKTYYLLKDPNDPSYNKENDKIASKGAQQKRNTDLLNWNNYKRCLFDITPIYGDNAGIRYIDHHMQVYKQPKVILNSVYLKGIVMKDLVHIHPLILP